MTHLVLIRHGETEWNARGLYQGQLDSPLTDEGLAQAERMGERMRHHSPIAALDRLGQRHWGEQIAVVTHGGVLTAIFNHILGLAINAPRNFAIPNTGYNLVSDTGDGWRIETMGDISHLQGGALDDIA